MAITAVPIVPRNTKDNKIPLIANVGEKATQTFKSGTVVCLSTGYIAAWGGADPAGVAVLCGVSIVPGSNLTTANTPQVASFGSVPNQASAKNYAIGSPANDGKCQIYVADDKTIFAGTFGSNGSAATIAVTNVGVAYGLTIDSGSNYWYVDSNKSTLGTNTAVVVEGIDPMTSSNGTAITANTLALFSFRPAVVQAVSGSI